MPYITAHDGTRLYYEEAGRGTPVIFVHEYAGDYRTWEMQMRYFSRAHRCITYSQRGYPPSDVPANGAQYSQDIARDDVIALMDALKVDKAHVVGHSMGRTPHCMSASMRRLAVFPSWPPVAAGVQHPTRRSARK